MNECTTSPVVRSLHSRKRARGTAAAVATERPPQQRLVARAWLARRRTYSRCRERNRSIHTPDGPPAGPTGRVIGIERDRAQLEEARRQAASAGEAELVELRPGDAVDPPLQPAEWGTFDLVHARYLLEHVADPLAVVRTMVRAARPGGRIILADDDHDILRLWPEPPGLMLLWQAYIRSYDRLGNDPYVGRRLVSLLHEAGAVPARNNWVFFGGCAGSPAFVDIVENLARILLGAREAILATAHLLEKTFDDAIAALDDWSTRSDAAFWFAMCVAEGIKPTVEAL